MRTFSLSLLCVVFLFSCSKLAQESEADLDLSPEEISTSVYQFIKNLGYQDAEIRDIGEEYVVDGDILFAKDVLPQSATLDDDPKTKQYGTNYYVGYNRQPNITVRIDPSLNAIAGDIQIALNMWNNVPNNRLQFNLVTHTNQDILITNAVIDRVLGVCGVAFFPINGRPGNLVRIDLGFITGIGISQAQRRALIAHELGHTIGFRHTNWQGWGEPLSGTDPGNGARFSAQHILGTPLGNDPNSLMNARTCNTDVGNTLSNFDIIAMQFLYPANPPVPGAVPVFRYYRDANNIHNHFFTRDFVSMGDGNLNSYSFEGIAFFAFATQQVGTVPIYRYYNSSQVNHFYTRSSVTPPGYQFERIEFYAYPSSVNDAVPVHRYYHQSIVDHHYTKNQNESPMTNYVYEGIEFYAH